MQYTELDNRLTPIQRLTLFHDGSMTRFLELLYGAKVQTKVLREIPIEQNGKYLYNWQSLQPNASIQREVILYNQQNGPLIYAKSVWVKENYDKVMGDKTNEAIGNNMAKKQLSQRRVILVGCTTQLPFESGLEQKDVLARAYVVYEQDNLLFYMEEYMLN